MPLVISKEVASGAQPNKAWVDLLDLVKQDSGLSIDSQTTTHQLLEYVRKQPGIGPERVAEIASADFDRFVVVAAVPSNFTLNTTNGPKPITKVAGFTAEMPDGKIFCVYDADQCNSKGYCLEPEGSGDPISFPGKVLLYHELSHAYNFVVSGTTGDALELAARKDENEYRTEQGLPRRNLTSSTLGCGEDECTDCFITTAAARQLQTGDIERLQWLRDHIVRQSDIGQKWCSAIFKEYDQFSPRIAQCMRLDEELCCSMYWFTIAPLMTFYGAAEGWLTSVLSSTPPSKEKFIQQLSNFGAAFSNSPALEPLCDIARSATILSDNSLANGSVITGPWNARRTFSFIAHEITTSCAYDRWSRWVFLEPLVFIWRIIAEYSRDSHADWIVIQQFLSGWLETFPGDDPEHSASVLAEIANWLMAADRVEYPPRS